MQQSKWEMEILKSPNTYIYYDRFQKIRGVFVIRLNHSQRMYLHFTVIEVLFIYSDYVSVIFLRMALQM